MGLLTANTALITEKKSVQSCHDFELDIPRRDNVEYKYSYPSEGKLKGIVFIIPGFGDDSNLSYSDNLREYIAEKFSVIAVNVYYHCFYSRVENGAKLTLDASDKKLLHNHLDRYNIAYQDNSYFDALSDLDDKLDEQVQMGAISEALKHIVTMTLAPQHDEYQNFGVMQALDHLNVLKEIESMSLNFDTNCGVTLMGSSHGGYLAYLIAKLAPHKIDCVIDNSAYVQPPLNYIVGKEKDLLNSEYRMSNYRHIQINCFVKTLWTLDPTS
ncbi:MAG: DUF2920 family protein, partial [Epsilonproteobacteria bacterium]|nr:DUF2920 family protein [Campylobacterota bacterium]